MKTKLTILFFAFFAFTITLSAQGKGSKGTAGDTLQQKANHNSVRSNKSTIAGEVATNIDLVVGTNIHEVAAGTAVTAVSKPVYHNGKLYSFSGSDADYAKLGSTCDCTGVSVKFTNKSTDCAKNCKLVIPAAGKGK
jgi:hypothetical protein